MTKDKEWCVARAQMALDNGAEDMAGLFHVAAERRGSRKIRIAVLSWQDANGAATWEADMPAGVVN